MGHHGDTRWVLIQIVHSGQPVEEGTAELVAGHGQRLDPVERLNVHAQLVVGDLGRGGAVEPFDGQPRQLLGCHSATRSNTGYRGEPRSAHSSSPILSCSRMIPCSNASG